MVPKLVSKVLSLGQVVQWEGLRVVEQKRWVLGEVAGRVVGLTVSSDSSIGWEKHPVERERVRAAMGDVLVWLGWLIVK